MKVSSADITPVGSNEIIPAGAPVLVQYDTDATLEDDKVFVFDVVTDGTPNANLLPATSDTEANYDEKNALSGTLARRQNYTAGNVYGFANKEAGVGFYQSKLTVVPANKAYLDAGKLLPEANGVRPAALILGFGDGVETGVEVEAAGRIETYYDLNGRVVAFPSHGIYVKKDGTKVFFK